MIVLALALFASGCKAVGPDYARPELTVPEAYRDASAVDSDRGAWHEGRPADTIPRGEWWRIFGDPELDALEERVTLENQELKAAIARIEEARSIVGVRNADRLPSVNVDADYTRTQYSQNGALPFPAEAVDNIRVPAVASWEIDLWGGIKRSVEAAEHESEATIAAFHSLQLILHAEVASNFFTLRAQGQELDTLERTVALRSRALDLLRARLSAGDANELDVVRAESELANAQAESAAVARRRSEVQSSLAVLVGEPASSFEIARTKPDLALAQPNLPAPPDIPAGLPSELLERRPDIAVAERELAARNARIGVAKAAFFPTLRLTGFGGFESQDVDNLFSLDSAIWGFGPSLSVPIFEGGRNEANLRLTRAAFDEGVAQYRQSVLRAFKEVQDALTATRLLAEQGAALDRSMKSARRAVELARTRFDAGFVGYIDVIEADRTALIVERAAVLTAGQRLVNAVELVKALGGGWSSAELPSLAAVQ